MAVSYTFPECTPMNALLSLGIVCGLAVGATPLLAQSGSETPARSGSGSPDRVAVKASSTSSEVLVAERMTEPSLSEVRAATERFRDVRVALAEGYVRDPMNVCVTADMLGRPAEHGAMGVHFSRRDLLGVTEPPNPRVDGTGTHTDFLRPAILIYEPQADGSMELVAVENLVFIEAWEASGRADRPSYQGAAYDVMADDPATEVDEAHMFEPHYDMHVWLYRENPSGLFAQFNPNVRCDHHQSDAAPQN